MGILPMEIEGYTLRRTHGSVWVFKGNEAVHMVNDEVIKIMFDEIVHLRLELNRLRDEMERYRTGLDPR